MKLRFARGRRESLESLHPAYFALVMATGIVALALHLHGVPFAPTILFWFNALSLVVLLSLLGLRIRRYPKAFLADFKSHRRGVGFFTLVAAVALFGSELVFQMRAVRLAVFLWAAAAILWLLVMYGVLAALTTKAEKPSLAEGLNGGWLISVVATQSVSIMTALIASERSFIGAREPLMFAALALWLGGGALYLWLTTLIFLRCTFMPMSPEDLSPTYWVNMGAVAISTLAGATLLSSAALSTVVSGLAAFVAGFTVFFWAIGSWWIPMLFIWSIWRHLIRGVPFAYEPLYWGAVFPLGMYSVSTFRLAEALGAPFLMPVSMAFMVVASAAWLVALAGLAGSLVDRARLGAPRLPWGRRAL